MIRAFLQIFIAPGAILVLAANGHGTAALLIAVAVVVWVIADE